MLAARAQNIAPHVCLPAGMSRQACGWQAQPTWTSWMQLPYPMSWKYAAMSRGSMRALPIHLCTPAGTRLPGAAWQAWHMADSCLVCAHSCKSQRPVHVYPPIWPGAAGFVRTRQGFCFRDACATQNTRSCAFHDVSCCAQSCVSKCRATGTSAAAALATSPLGSKAPVLTPSRS